MTTNTTGEDRSAVISSCGAYRYRLERRAIFGGTRFAFFGVNPSTADASIDDATVRKWRGFVSRNGGGGFVVGNVFAYRATDVRALASAADPVGPDNAMHIQQIMQAADVLVPCWGGIAKLPAPLRWRCGVLLDELMASGKPVLTFGLTACGNPKHPLMLGYGTPLIPYIEGRTAA